MVTISEALSRRSGTYLKFFNPNLPEGKQHYFLGKRPKEHLGSVGHPYRQGTRRYCKRCRNVMRKSKQIGRPSVTLFHSSGRTGSFHEYKCPKGHTMWGQ